MGLRRAATVLAIASITASASAYGDTVPLTPADRTEITALLRHFFESVRDGAPGAAATDILDHDGFVGVFREDATAFVEHHVRAVDRDVRALHDRFAGGTWVGLSSADTAATTVDVHPCGTFARRESECIDGPVIEWRAAGAVQRLRIDRLVRWHGHWRIFDPRL